jgi:LexA-binding, inner membrane-associated putative hydrolase
MTITRAVARRWMSAVPWLLTSLGVFLIDVLLQHHSLPLGAMALLDESAHAATGLLFLRAFYARLPPLIVMSLLVGAVLIDVDHIPMHFGWDFLTQGTERPYTHSLIIAGCGALLGLLLTGTLRLVILAAAFGLVTHLLRDMATGGLALYWPVTDRTVLLPYPGYTGMLLIALIAGILRDYIANISCRCGGASIEEDERTESYFVTSKAPHFDDQ